MKTLRALTLALIAAGTFSIAAAEGVRPEIGKPLQQASELLRAGKAKEALVKVREAEAVGGKTAFEQLTIERMKAAAAQRAGDTAAAIQALEALYGRVGGAEQGQIAEQIASAYAQQRNNAKAGEWLNKAIAAGDNSATVHQLQNYLHAASGDYNAIAREAGAAVAAAEQAGRRPEENDLLRLADAQLRLNNTAGHIATLEKLVLFYGKKDYWSALLSRLPRKPGFSDRYSLDVLRLRQATGTLTSAEDYMELAQMAMQAGLPTEARKVTELGFKNGVLGTGAEAARHQRLRDLAIKEEAQLKGQIATQANEARGFSEGDALVKVGTSYVGMGEVEKGISLIQAGIAKGKLKHPEEARLRLGQAQMLVKRQQGVQTLRGVHGGSGADEIARLWIAANSNG
ncbi:MAG: hypothetical protein KGL18_04840 [Burkholderiales bacterium]|nr:hypothetical protein [Burkholderiales bacterium]MDE1927493.1 hypothetical protein [Burkholderiales bacterium]MDE2157891.1 hypothetical protein [Burkholderiales bacterium]MDE2502291.1 hypothetical protein [Burkholderiales bacterium]